MWPQLRPLCRRLALLGWAASTIGMAAGLAVAIASGTRVSALMSIMQLVAAVSLAVSLAIFVPAAVLQPRLEDGRPEDGFPPGDPGHGAGDFPGAVQSLLLGSLALLAGAVAFAAAGLMLKNGPSAQSLAFCQVFLLGAVACGFTFLLFSKVTSRRSGS